MKTAAIFFGEFNFGAYLKAIDYLFSDKRPKKNEISKIVKFN